MIRNSLWLLVTVAALTLALVYPTSANQGVPLGRDSGTKTAVVTTNKTPAPTKNHFVSTVPTTTR